MPKNMGNYLNKQIKSFGYAFKGLGYMWKDHNTYIHFPAAVIVVCLGWYVDITHSEWLWLVLAIASMWISETFNTAIEKLTDLVSPEHNPLAGKVKDIAAAGVLLTLFFAAIVGIMIFFPYFYKFALSS